jgi:hypothetical protein
MAEPNTAVEEGIRAIQHAATLRAQEEANAEYAKELAVRQLQHAQRLVALALGVLRDTPAIYLTPPLLDKATSLAQEIGKAEAGADA